MKRLPFLAAVVSAALAMATGLVSASAAVASVSTDPYANTTSFHATEVEPDTFSNGSTIVSAFQQGRFQDGGASNIGWATSTNAGTSWTHGSLPGITKSDSAANPYARDTDAAVAFDAKHNVWLIVSLPLNVSRRGAIVGAAVIVNRSTDGGLTWGDPVTVAAASGSQDFDKTWIACDSHSASPHYGNCYAQWDDHGHRNQLFMAVSSDGGMTWKQATVPRSVVIGGQPLAQPNGNVVVPIDNGYETAVESFVSTDGGLTYTGPYSVSSISNHTDAGGLRSGPLPTAEVDAGGTVYVAWSDCRFIASCTANDIVFSTSTNGTAWSSPHRIPIDTATSGVDHFLPGLAVDTTTSGSTAALGLTYYYYPNSSCTTSTCQLDVGFIGSSTGGTTWGSATQLAGPSSLNELPDTSQGYMVGDYISSSFVTGTNGDVALSVFAVGMAVSAKTCALGDVTSCNVPMEAPTSGLAATSAALQPATTGPIMSRQSDHAAPQSEVARR